MDRERFKEGLMAYIKDPKKDIAKLMYYAKGTPSLLTKLRPLVGARFQGLFHSSIRSAFHLSFTVLVRYRSLGSI